MLKRAAAITLLCVFAWSHYVRQAIYLECRLASSFKSYGVPCDCEKKSGLNKSGTENQPLPVAHSHLHPDELFPVTCMIRAEISPAPIKNLIIPLRNEKDSQGWSGKPFHPPRCS